MTSRLLAAAFVAAIVSGCVADARGYLSAEECLEDRACRREWREEKRAERKQHSWRHARKKTAHVHTAGWERNRDRHGPVCQTRPVTATGEKALSQENAEIFALRIWKSEVVFEYGEQYLDFHKARHPQMHCAPVGIADSFSGRIKEKLLGVTHWRCRISAYPCRGRPEAVQRDD